MPDLSSEDDLGKYARQDPNGVCGHGMARLPGGVARKRGTADPDACAGGGHEQCEPPSP